MVITISRQFATGGHTIAQRVAEKLGIAFYDKELVNRVAKESGFDVDFVTRQGEHMGSNSLLFDLVTRNRASYEDPTDKLFRIQKQIILDLGTKEDCVIVGRCAGFLLREAGIDCLRVFIGADMEYRKAYMLSHYEDTGVPAEKRLKERDSRRQSYVHHYTGAVWGQREYYNLCLDSGYLGEDACVDIILRAAQK